MAELLQLFFSFFKVGLFTFGGGYAMLPILKREISGKRQWVTDQEILDYFSISQCAPGVIAVNTATMIGYKRRGISGSVFSTLGVVAPSVLIILTIAIVLQNFAHLEIVQHAFAGIRVSVAMLILYTVVTLIKGSVKSAAQIVVCILSFIFVVLGQSPIFVIVGAALLGLAFGKWGKKTNE